MKISVCNYVLELKHQFTISTNSRKTTPVVIIKMEHEGYTGYGEASLPPYLAETQDSVVLFIRKFVKCFPSNMIDNAAAFHEFVDALDEGNNAAKASLDIAYHDLLGKMHNKPVRKLYEDIDGELPLSSMTIGIDEETVLKKKIEEAEEFKILKIKLGSDNDKNIVEVIRKYSDKPLFVDANQGWVKKELAFDMIDWLAYKNVLLIEQPMPKNCYKEMRWLKERSPLPLFADESIQRLSDIEKIKDCFHGINIKLMKCTGIYEANEMIKLARKENLKIMLGCMTETSCGISAAIQLASKVDFADLDGNYLVSNDPFNTVTQIEGRLIYLEDNGLGVTPINTLSFRSLE